MGQHPKKLELSWHKPFKQWRKRHKGKEYYLGTAGGTLAVNHGGIVRG